MIMCPSHEIEVDDLPSHIRAPSSRIPLNLEEGMTLKDLREHVERQYIIETLKKTKWNVSQAAKDLDVDRTNLHKKINYYRLSEREHG